MAGAAPNVPDESVLLCEGCGYILTGIPDASCCPECGQPVSQSLPETRKQPVWEQKTPTAPVRWLLTTVELLFHPARFYRSLPTRSDPTPSRRFSSINCIAVSILFGLTGYLQFDYLELWRLFDRLVMLPDAVRTGCAILAFSIVTWITLTFTTHLAGRLTAWEASYRGFRLPHGVVMRGLHYHTAHYFPVALLALATVGGYRLGIRLRWFSELYAGWYIYLLCGEVIGCAFYLFKTYWIGMRKMMFANG